MRRIMTLAIAAMLVVSMMGMTAVADASDDTEDDSANVAPGERMSGVLYVVEAEIEGEIAERGFGISVAQAATSEAKADVVGEQLADIEQRLADLEEREQELKESYKSGEISQGKYQAKMAKLAVEIRTTERLASSSDVVAGELPEELLEERGINVTAIELLRTQANEMTGPEVAAIAKTIAGPSVAEQLPDRASDRVPEDRGPPEDSDLHVGTEAAVEDGEDDNGDQQDP